MEQEILHDTIYVVQSAASSGITMDVDLMREIKMTLNQTVVPIVIICTIAVLSFAILRLAITSWYKERMARIEKGILALPEKSPNMPKLLRWGIILASIGLGCTIAFITRNEGLLIGLPLAFMGAGLIIYYFLLREKKSAPQE
jgi:uncharacterized membrane protein YeiB